MSDARQKRLRWNQPDHSLRHLMGLCMALVLVMVLMRWAADPASWKWLTGMDGLSEASSNRAVSDITRSLEPEALEDGVFVATRRDPDGADSEGKGWDKSPVHDQSEARLDPAVFEGVQDITRALPPRPYFHLLDLARRTPEVDMERESRRDITFAHLVKAPARYRGQLIFLRGHLRRFTEIPAPANSEGFEQLYEGWLFTEESQANPYVIIVSRVPQGMPLGGGVLEDVSFAGYFFKLWKYWAADGERFAPLLIGHRVTWHPRPVRSGTSVQTHVVMISLVTLLIAALCAVTWWGRKSAAALRRMHASSDELSADEAARAMSRRAGTATEEFLARIEQDAGRVRGSGFRVQEEDSGSTPESAPRP